MKEIVYIETSFVSLLVAEPSRDVSVAGNQQVSREEGGFCLCHV